MDETLQEFVSSRGRRRAGRPRGRHHPRREAAGARVAQRPPLSARGARRRPPRCTRGPRSTSTIPRGARWRPATTRTAWARFATCGRRPTGCSAICTSTPSTRWPSNWPGTPSTPRRTWAFRTTSKPARSRSSGQTVVEAILKVQSVDLVADPATTRGLYESASGRPEAGDGVHADESGASDARCTARRRPDLVEAIRRPKSAAELTSLREQVEAIASRAKRSDGGAKRC